MIQCSLLFVVLKSAILEDFYMLQVGNPEDHECFCQQKNRGFQAKKRALQTTKDEQPTVAAQ